MREIRRCGAKLSSLAAIVAGIALMPALASSIVTAQERPIDEVRPVRENTDLTTPTVVMSPQQGRGAQVSIGRRGLVGSPVKGLPVKSDSVRPSGTEAITAGPISSCAPNAGGGITCNIFETDASGNRSEISNAINVGSPVTGGYLVLKENPAAPDSDQSQWSEVLLFAPAGGSASTVQLFSAGCNTANPSDRSCLPSLAAVNGDPDSGFVNGTHGGVTVYTSGPNIYNIFSVEDTAPDRPFSLASSVGTVDEDSLSLVQFRNFTVTFLPAATGSVHVRYNITAVGDIARFCPATQSAVKVRFRNSDNSGATAQVLFDIHVTNITSGGNSIIYSFSSNGRGAGGSFTTASDSPAIDFDFGNNIYWIEATVTRTNTSALADLGSIQIWEAAGTPCP
jgi:hypothetical protein